MQQMQKSEKSVPRNHKKKKNHLPVCERKVLFLQQRKLRSLYTKKSSFDLSLGDSSCNIAAKPIFTQGVREEESTRTMRTASRAAREGCARGRGQFAEFSGDWQDWNSWFFSEVSQELTCGLAKKALENTSLCFRFYIHRYTYIQNLVYGDIIIIIIIKIPLRIENLQIIWFLKFLFLFLIFG
jgi:hypothetical protein